MNAGAETSVLLFKLCDPVFEVGVLCLATVARVLGGYSVAVCTSLFTLLWGDGGARAFAGRLFSGTRTGMICGGGGGRGAFERGGGEGEGRRVYEGALLLCHGERTGRVVRKGGNGNKDMVKGNCA